MLVFECKLLNIDLVRYFDGYDNYKQTCVTFRQVFNLPLLCTLSFVIFATPPSRFPCLHVL